MTKQLSGCPAPHQGEIRLKSLRSRCRPKEVRRQTKRIQVSPGGEGRTIEIVISAIQRQENLVQFLVIQFSEVLSRYPERAVSRESFTVEPVVACHGFRFRYTLMSHNQETSRSRPKRRINTREVVPVNIERREIRFPQMVHAVLPAFRPCQVSEFRFVLVRHYEF